MMLPMADGARPDTATPIMILYSSTYIPEQSTSIIERGDAAMEDNIPVRRESC